MSKPCHEFGRHWNNEVFYRHEWKRILEKEAQDHRGLWMTAQPSGAILECSECGTYWTPGPEDPLNHRCPRIVGAVRGCLNVGCTNAEINMVWQRATE